MNASLSAARIYASLGLATFPVRGSPAEARKQPANFNGVHGATLDEGQHAAWWGGESGDSRGVAVACGAASGIVVLDIDPRHGGDEALAALESEHGPMPATPTVLTPGGGRHLYYRGVAATRKIAGNGAVDLRGTGSYVVAPPSLHPCGRRYSWDFATVGEDGWPREFSPAPAWLIEPPVDRTGVAPTVAGESDPSRLSRATLLFLQFGALKGEQNARLFAAACDMAGCGYSHADAEARLLDVWRGLPNHDDEREAIKTIASAFSKPRSSAIPQGAADDVGGEIVLPDSIRLDGPTNAVPASGDGVAGASTSTESRPKSRARVVPSTPSNRALIANVIDTTRKTRDGEVTPVTLYKPTAQVAAEIIEASGGWPRQASGVLFVDRGESFGTNRVRWLSRSEEFYGWLHEVGVVRWHSGKCYDEAAKRHANGVAKPEFYASMRDEHCERYLAVAPYPHHPLMPGVYYLDVTLPPADGKCLGEFLDHLNPETKLDRWLMLAAMLTPGWGGEPGTRPAFVFTSKYGMGAGKTATAQAIADIWGGGALLDYRDEWPEVSKRIMSSDDRDKRVFTFDNIKGVFGGTGLEAALTAKTITGHRMYVGTVSRPNDATYFITFNSPEMSPDLTQRAVPINIGAPRHGFAFVKWAAEFVREHRLQLIADLLAILRRPTPDLPTGSLDRWQAWAQGVLSKCPEPGALLELIADRRPAMDSEAEDRDEWAAMLARLVRDRVGTPVGEVTAHDVHAAAIEAKLWRSDPSRPESHDRQFCLRKACRLLAGTGLIEPAVNDNGSKKMGYSNARTPNNSGQRSRVYVVNAKSSESVEDTDDLPI